MYDELYLGLMSEFESNQSLQKIEVAARKTVALSYARLKSHVADVSSKVATWEGNSKVERKITRERLVERLDFDCSTGNFRWSNPLWDRYGQIAGAVSTERGKSYVRIGIDGERIMAHALVWLYVHNEWPDFEIDHINGIGTDNRPENLRKSNRLLNNSNTRRRKDAAEHKSIHITPCGKYTGMVKYAKLHTSLGTHKTLESAIAARDFLESLIPRLESHGIDKID